MSASTAKTCEQCSGPCHRLPDESPVNWEARRFCSRACVLAYMRQQRPKPTVDRKTCSQCGEEFERRPRHEGPKTWGRRKYCSHVCAQVARRVSKPVPKAGVKATPKRRPARVPAAPPSPEQPAWRPAGWGPIQVEVAS